MAVHGDSSRDAVTREIVARITITQEDRIRVVDDLGRGYLFTVGKGRARLRDLERWRDHEIPLRIRYRGTPDAGAVAEAIQPITSPSSLNARRRGRGSSRRSGARRLRARPPARR